MERVARLVIVNEYKRRQAALGVRITRALSDGTGAIRLPRDSGADPVSR